MPGVVVLVTALLGFPIVRCWLDEGGGVCVYGEMEILSKLRRYVPPETFLIEKRTAFGVLTVKVAVVKVVEVVVMAEPTFE